MSDVLILSKLLFLKIAIFSASIGSVLGPSAFLLAIRLIVMLISLVVIIGKA